MTHQAHHCINCHHALLESDKYCSQCGQSAHVHPINAAHLLHEVVHFFTHADKGIFYLIKQLMVRPGHVAREYIAGRRKKYFNPVSFYFIVAGLFVFAITTFHTFERYRTMDAIRQQVQHLPDTVERNRRLEKIDRAEKAQKFVSRYANFVSMIATPLSALILFLCFIRYRFNYMEHLIANLYFAGFYHLVFILIVAPLINLFDSGSVYLYAIIGFLLFETIYRSIGYYQLINKRGALYFLHALGASILVTLVWSYLSRSMISLYINTGFNGLL